MGWLRDVDELRRRCIKTCIAPLGVHHKRSYPAVSLTSSSSQSLHILLLLNNVHFGRRCSPFTSGLIFPPVLPLEFYELTFAHVFFSNSCFVFANAHKSF